MSSSNDMPQMYQANVKAKQPDYQGIHYADNPPGANVSPISVTYDQFGNEITADKPMHENTTAADGSFNWDGNQYAGGNGDGPWKGGYGANYGQSAGSTNSVERTSVNVSRADRGKES